MGIVLDMKPGSEDKETTFKKVLTFLDFTLSMLVVSPLVVATWRGLWLVLDLHEVPFSVSLGTGLLLHCVFMMARGKLMDVCTPDKMGTLMFFIVSRSYTVLFGSACVMAWRGGWHILDDYVAMDQPSGPLWMLGSSLLLLGLLKTLCNLPLPLFNLEGDTQQVIFDFPSIMFCKNGRIDGEIDRHVNAYRRVVGYMWNEVVSKEERMAVCKKGGLIPTMFDGCEAWVCQEKHKSKVNAFGMKYLRNVCGKSRMDRISNEWVLKECVGVRAFTLRGETVHRFCTLGTPVVVKFGHRDENTCLGDGGTRAIHDKESARSVIVIFLRKSVQIKN
uniref:Uncharacterized protein n=1 Tax=Timema bartmani TaxID=61472 RepID=A0A7R9F5N2_9NEOP|nr:unnamed protein product [Timema bartmani]